MNFGKKLLLIVLSLVSTSCSQSVNLEDLKEQIREEISNEITQKEKNNIISENKPNNLISEKSNLPEDTVSAAKESIDALYELNTRVGVGLNYASYSTAFSDTKIVVDKFKRKELASEHPAFKDITDAIVTYDFAVMLWDCYLTDEESSNNLIGGLCYDGFSGILKNNYNVNETDILNTKKIYLPFALSAIWKKAFGYIESANTFYNTNQINNADNQEASPITKDELVRLSGKAINSNDIPVEGFGVSISYKENDNYYYASKFTDSNGHYTIEGIPKGTFIKIVPFIDAYRMANLPSDCFHETDNYFKENISSINIDKNTVRDITNIPNCIK